MNVRLARCRGDYQMEVCIPVSIIGQPQGEDHLLTDRFSEPVFHL